jgi:hypothetical protein
MRCSEIAQRNPQYQINQADYLRESEAEALREEELGDDSSVLASVFLTQEASHKVVQLRVRPRADVVDVQRGALWSYGICGIGWRTSQAP